MNINFIPRIYQNIYTNEKEEFTQLIKFHIKLLPGGVGYENMHYSNIAIILGEPASGKTYQLKDYNRKDSNSYFIELVNLKDNDIIDKNINLVLIDSIDEALTDFNNPKKLQNKLTNFIIRCMDINPKVRFVISCRFLEWNNYFKESLQEIDKDLRVYEILPLIKKDIDNLLNEKDKNSEMFWEFIQDNYLENLLKNIIIVLHLIDNFEKYKNSSNSYIDLYNNITKKYLSQKGFDRISEIDDISLDDLMLISSSLATFMTFNRMSSIDINNLEIISSELYKVNNQEIVANNLKTLLNRGLFNKNDKEISFFHKTIQEYLTAYFLSNKKLSLEELKKLLASEHRFYEEFEEIVVYLTNLKPKLFDDFVEFDPFIFKRHPNLTKEQQEKLLLSILNKYKTDFSQVWGRWESFEGTTLVKFDKLDNFVDILQKNATLKVHGFYLMKLVEYNHNDKLMQFIFELFEKNITDKKMLKEVIVDNFIDNIDFNLQLYKFLKENSLLKKDIGYSSITMSFEAKLFSSLYGIKYEYGFERILKRTDIEFTEIMPILDYISESNLKYIIPYLLKKDSKIWFDFSLNNSSIRHNYYLMRWVVYSVLKYCNSEEEFIEILNKIQENEIILLFSHEQVEIDLDIQSIENFFWKVYFETDTLEAIYTQEVISLYNISIDNIKKIIHKYPIEEYLKKYYNLIFNNKDIKDFLMINKDFERYIIKLQKEQEEYLLKEKKRIRKNYPDFEKQKQKKEKLFIDAVSRFGTNQEKKKDFYNIFFYAVRKRQEDIKVKSFLEETLGSKYIDYIKKVEQKFKRDTLYRNIKKDLLSSSNYYDTLIFDYYVDILSDNEFQKLIKTKKDYIKLYWHQISTSFFSKNFINITNKYFDCFCLLALHTLKIEIEQNNKKEIDKFSSVIKVFKELDQFNNHSLKHIIEYLVDNKNLILNFEKFYDKEYLLEILSLDKNNYSLIQKLMLQDKSNMYIYLELLLKIDVKKAMVDFFRVYNQTKKYKPWLVTIKEKFDKSFEINKYDNPKISKEKKELYFSLMKAIKKSNNILDSISNNHYLEILNNYYEFFSEYERPKGVYSPDIYDYMDSLINKIWNQMENSKYIDILKELAKSNNSRLSDRAKYALTKAYEHQQKERNYPNSYYKKIFDKDESMGKINIEVKGDGNNIAVNSTKIKQKSSTKLENSKNMWWLYSVIAGVITIFTIWWSYDSWKLAVGGGILSFIIVWKLNPKFRFRNIGYALLGTGIVLNAISISGQITIPKNDLIYGIVNIDESNVSILLILLSILFFVLDYFENKHN